MPSDWFVEKLHEHIAGLQKELEARPLQPMAEVCAEERKSGNGGCGACSICCGELQKKNERLERQNGDCLRFLMDNTKPSLEGYRELGQRAADAENNLDAALSENRRRETAAREILRQMDEEQERHESSRAELADLTADLEAARGENAKWQEMWDSNAGPTPLPDTLKGWKFISFQTEAMETYRKQLAATEARVGALREALEGVVSAWESLPEGHYSVAKAQAWVSGAMKTGIDAARAALAESGVEDA